MRLVNLNSFQYLGLGSSKFAICFWITNAARSSEPGPKNTDENIPSFWAQLVEDYLLRCAKSRYALPPFGRFKDESMSSGVEPKTSDHFLQSLLFVFDVTGASYEYTEFPNVFSVGIQT